MKQKNNLTSHCSLFALYLNHISRWKIFRVWKNVNKQTHNIVRQLIVGVVVEEETIVVNLKDEVNIEYTESQQKIWKNAQNVKQEFNNRHETWTGPQQWGRHGRTVNRSQPKHNLRILLYLIVIVSDAEYG